MFDLTMTRQRVMAKRTLDPKQTFLDLLRETRLSAEVSQVDLATRLGWTQTDISKVERGVRRLDVLELRSWMLGLGVPVVKFVGELDRRLEAQAALGHQWGARKGTRP